MIKYHTRHFFDKEKVEKGFFYGLMGILLTAGVILLMVMLYGVLKELFHLFHFFATGSSFGA